MHECELREEPALSSGFKVCRSKVVMDSQEDCTAVVEAFRGTGVSRKTSRSAASVVLMNHCCHMTDSKHSTEEEEKFEQRDWAYSHFVL